MPISSQCVPDGTRGKETSEKTVTIPAWAKWSVTWAIVALVGGCSVTIHPHAASRSPVPATSPAPTTASPPVAAIRPGSQDCTFDANDGRELASVTVTGTECKSWITDLAHDGQNWWQVSYQAPATEAADGGVQVCALSLHGVTMNVYDQPSNAPQQTPAGIAQGVCQGSEQYGWAPS